MTLAEAFQTALDFEHEARKYYLAAARNLSDMVLVSVLGALAHDEELHRSLIRRYYDAMKKTAAWPDVSADLPAPQPARKRVAAILETTAGAIGKDAAYLDVYEHARDLEVASRDFYREFADQTQDGEVLKLFRFLAGMEQTHLEMLGLLLSASREEAEGPK